MAGSGEHRLDLAAAPTEPCSAPPPESQDATWPKIPAAPRVPNLDPTLDLDDSELF